MPHGLGLRVRLAYFCEEFKFASGLVTQDIWGCVCVCVTPFYLPREKHDICNHHSPKSRAGACGSGAQGPLAAGPRRPPSPAQSRCTSPPRSPLHLQVRCQRVRIWGTGHSHQRPMGGQQGPEGRRSPFCIKCLQGSFLLSGLDSLSPVAKRTTGSHL